MKIVFFETMPEERALLEPILPTGHEVVFLKNKLTLETSAMAAGAQVISVFVKSDLSSSVLELLPDLKLIVTRSMGFDHIDIEYAKSKSILVNNVTTYASHPVAEFTFALMLAVVRKIYPAYNQLREGSNFDQRGLAGFNLFGKTLGVLGTGRIGRNVVAIAKGFGMKVIAFDAFPDKKLATELSFTYAPLLDAIGQSDVITIHVPYSQDTHHMLNAQVFGHMKKGAVLINTARGEIVDTHALVAALRDGTIWGAGLDVLEEERNLYEEANAFVAKRPDVNYELLTANHILIDLPNVIITPHIAFATNEAIQEIDRVTAETISNFISGKEQKYL